MLSWGISHLVCAPLGGFMWLRCLLLASLQCDVSFPCAVILSGRGC